MFPRCGTLFTYGSADVISMFLSPGTGSLQTGLEFMANHNVPPQPRQRKAYISSPGPGIFISKPSFICFMNTLSAFSSKPGAPLLTLIGLSAVCTAACSIPDFAQELPIILMNQVESTEPLVEGAPEARSYSAEKRIISAGLGAAVVSYAKKTMS